jgi:hypothetical protein
MKGLGVVARDHRHRSGGDTVVSVRNSRGGEFAAASGAANVSRLVGANGSASAEAVAGGSRHAIAATGTRSLIRHTWKYTDAIPGVKR